MKRRISENYMMPTLIWLTLFFLIPIMIILSYSFFKSDLYGGVVFQFSLSSFKALLNRDILIVIIHTLVISLISTGLVLILAFPVAFYIAKSQHKNALLFLVVTPFWVSQLIRIYAWITLLNNNGVLNHVLLKIGMIHSPIQFLYNSKAIILITVYSYLPYAILPIYSRLEKFDFTLEDSAYDLGATQWTFIMKVMLPNIKSSLLAAGLFVFIPTMGSYLIPGLVGGMQSMMIGNLIGDAITVNRDWPLGAALSLVLTVTTLIGILIFTKKTDIKHH